MGKVYGYGRASTDKQTLTIAAQEEKVRQYCQMEGLELASFVKDPATSSRKPFGRREGGQKLCDLVAKGKVSHIVIAKLDRAFRSTVESLTTLQKWQDAGVKVHLLDLKVDTSTPLGLFFLSVLSAVAEFERGQCGERTKAALRHAQANGKVVSRYLPYGYEWDKSSEEVSPGRYSKMQECEEEQRVLLVVDRLVQLGANAVKIQEVLNGEGYRQRNGKPWSRQFVNRLVQRHKK